MLDTGPDSYRDWILDIGYWIQDAVLCISFPHFHIFKFALYSIAGFASSIFLILTSIS